MSSGSPLRLSHSSVGVCSAWLMYLSRRAIRRSIFSPSSSAADSTLLWRLPERRETARTTMAAAMSAIENHRRMFMRLFMMVWLSLQDGESPVQLLCKDGAHHLVREGHFGKGNLPARPLVNGLREAVGPSNGENKVLGTRP